MSPSSYGALMASLLLVICALGYGAVRVRRRLMPDASGALARLAELVLGLGAMVVLAEVLGIVGILTRWGVLTGAIAAGAAMAAAGTGRQAGPLDRSSRTSWPGLALAVGVAVFLILLWAPPMLERLRGGMTDGDTVWYHMQFAARFAQDGSITALDYTGPDYLSWFYPANAELLHAVGILLADHRDLLSPLLALGWLGLALLAAWCIGRPFGAGGACVLGVGLLLGTELVVAREPGAARTDVAGLAFLLAAAALLVNGRRGERLELGAIGLAGCAAGLAIGTKLTLLGPVVALSLGVVAINRGLRLRTAGVWLTALGATGGFWYARNLVVSGNPLPWVDLGIGPVTLAGAIPDPAHAWRGSVLEHLTDPFAWRHFFLPGLEAGFGTLWPALLAAAACGAVVAVGLHSGIVRVLGAVAAISVVAYVANPMSAPGPDGAPTQFATNLRYLMPALGLGLALLPAVLPARARRASVGVLAALLLTTAAQPEFDDSSAWGALLIAGLAVLVASGAVFVGRGQIRAGSVAAIAAAASILLAGWVLVDDYGRHRYRASLGSKLERAEMDAVYRWAREVRGARIATTSVLSYGLYGPDLSNRVRYVGVAGPRGSFADATNSRAWWRAIDSGAFDYIVLAPTYQERLPAAPAEWLRSARVRPILSSGPTTVYRVRNRVRTYASSRR